jgi:two-component system response regulator AlgR
VRVLIVDDEAPARERLRRLVAEVGGGWEVIGQAANGEEALDVCRAGDVDLVLLDINMPGMGGLEAAQALARLDPPPAVVLVTAYGEYALDAFERHVADYLVKPVRRERLQEALARLQVTNRPQRAALSGSATGGPGRRRHLTAHYRGGLQVVAIEDVIYLRAEQKYVTARHLSGSLLLDESLKSLERELDDLFLRIHRNTLVARRWLVGLEKDGDGTSYARLRGCEERLAVSRRHLAEVRRRLRSDGRD